MLIPDRQLFHSVGQDPVPHTWIIFQVARRLDPRQAIPIQLRPNPTERVLLRELARQFTGIGTGDRDRILHVSMALLHLVLSRREIHWQSGLPTRSIAAHHPAYGNPTDRAHSKWKNWPAWRG